MSWSIKSNSYYHTPGVRETCHAVKQSNDPEQRSGAIKKMADDLVRRNIVQSGDILIPAPQHSGHAEYTKEIADIVSERTGAIVADILKCTPHPTLYDQKKEKLVPTLTLYLDGSLPEGKHIYLVDNVISTGLTFRTANELLHYQLQPLVYAVGIRDPDLGKESIEDYFMEMNDDEILRTARSLDEFAFAYDYYSYVDSVGIEPEEREDAVARLAYELKDPQNAKSALREAMEWRSEDSMDLWNIAVGNLLNILGNDQDCLPIPDDSITINEMNEYGYTDKDMYPIRDLSIAEDLFRNGEIEVYRLGRHNTSFQCLHADDLKEDLMYGVKVVDWFHTLDYTHDMGYDM